MKTSPLFAFALTVAIAILFCGVELRWVLDRRGKLLEKEAQNRAALQENEVRRKDIVDLQAHKEAILETVQKITNGIVHEAPAPGSFEPLRRSGIRVVPSGEGHGFEYSFSSELEFHRLVPALAALESDYPLLRITELEIISNHNPFTKSASGLNFEGKFMLMRAQAVSSQFPSGSIRSDFR